MRRTTALLFIALGFFFLGLSGFFLWQRTTPSRIAFKLNEIQAATTSAAAHETVSSRPTVIKLASVGLELPIVPTELKNGHWQATTEGVSYLISSPLPGEIGNSIFYGHNWPNILGNLPQIKPGDTIEVDFSDGSHKKFRIEYTLTVTPDQTHILNPSQDRRLTLYTCTGFLDSKRFVAVAIIQPPETP